MQQAKVALRGATVSSNLLEEILGATLASEKEKETARRVALALQKAEQERKAEQARKDALVLAERARVRAARVAAAAAAPTARFGWYTSKAGKRCKYRVVAEGRLRGRKRLQLAFHAGRDSKTFWVDASRVAEIAPQSNPDTRGVCDGTGRCRSQGLRKGSRCNPDY